MISDLEIAVLNAHGYKDGKDSVNGTLEKSGITIAYRRVKYFEPVFDVEAVLYELDDCTVLNMRGTELTSNPKRWYVNWLDIIRDLRFLPWRTPFGWGHSGFYKGARHWLNEHQADVPTNKPLILTGHSMGAQLAIWLALMSGWMLHRVVVFAEPKGLFASSKNAYRKLGLDVITRSYLTNRDPIEDAPPWGKRSVVPKYAGEGGHDIDDYIKAIAKRMQ